MIFFTHHSMKVVVISGGTATNNIIEEFLPSNKDDKLTFILPVSDNGGSSGELQRIFGGFSIGDIRSRLVRLMTNESIQGILMHRLSNDEIEARKEWERIINDSEIDIIIRNFLNFMDVQIEGGDMKLARASIGNMFLFGCKMIMGMKEAIELMNKIGGIPNNIHVYGCTYEDVNIYAKLANGKVIIGQSEISHPVDGNSQLMIDKECEIPLESPIKEVGYVKEEGEGEGDNDDKFANDETLQAIEEADTIVYSIGSLWTSIVPVLITKGISERIRRDQRKILLVNGWPDRETSGMNREDYKNTIAQALDKRVDECIDIVVDPLIESIRDSIYKTNPQ